MLLVFDDDWLDLRQVPHLMSEGLEIDPTASALC